MKMERIRLKRVSSEQLANYAEREGGRRGREKREGEDREREREKDRQTDREVWKYLEI